MSNPLIEAEKVMVGHGLDVERLARRGAKQVKKSWTERLKERGHGHEQPPEAANENSHDMPVQGTFEQLFTEAWSNADKPISGEHHEIYHLAEIEARRELQRSLDSNAMLKLSPGDYMKLYSEMQDLAHAMVRETRNLAAGAGKTQIGTNVFREKVKQTVHKYIGKVHGPSHVECEQPSQAAGQKASLLGTLTHLCGRFGLNPHTPVLGQQTPHPSA